MLLLRSLPEKSPRQFRGSTVSWKRVGQMVPPFRGRRAGREETDPRSEDTEEDFDQHNPRPRIAVALRHLRTRTSVRFDDCIVQVIHLSSGTVTSVMGITYHWFRLATSSCMTAHIT
jgi:hypothetical protein